MHCNPGWEDLGRANLSTFFLLNLLHFFYPVIPECLSLVFHEF